MYHLLDSYFMVDYSRFTILLYTLSNVIQTVSLADVGNILERMRAIATVTKTSDDIGTELLKMITAAGVRGDLYIFSVIWRYASNIDNSYVWTCKLLAAAAKS